MPSEAALHLLREWQGLPGAIKLFAGSAFESALPLAIESTVVYGQRPTLLRKEFGLRK